MISRILVPVDFSPGSAAALRYAELMASSIGARTVKVIHVFTPQTAGADAVSIVPVGQLMDQADNTMDEFLTGIPSPQGVERSSELLLGFAGDKIAEEAENFDLVVMGTTGATDLLEEVFGTVASAVVERAVCPVLLIPRGTTFSNYEHIMYASNNLSLSRRAVLDFRKFNDLFHARVHFVHVKEGDTADQGKRQDIFSKLFSTPDPSFSFDIREIEADSVQDGLREYLNSHDIDLAVMVTKRRNFWARLFHQSETKQMLLHPTTPVLVLRLLE